MDDHDGVETIEHVCDPTQNQAERAKAMRDYVLSVLAGRPEVSRIVLFEADYHPRAKITDSHNDRLRLEGAALTACLDRTRTVIVANGPEVGRLLGTDKAGALQLAASKRTEPSYTEAVAAALAALAQAKP